MDHDEAMQMLRSIAAAFDGTISTGSWPTSPTMPCSRRRADPTRGAGGSLARTQVRSAFAGRFSGIPDVRYQQDDHFVDGDRGASEWTLSGTTTDGERLEIRGCDLWTIRDGRIVKKDSFWKIRTAD